MIGLSVSEFLALAVIPVLYRTVVAGDAAVDLGLSPAVRADGLFSGKVAVFCANGLGGGPSVIGQLIVFSYFTHKGGGSPPIRQFFSEEGVKHRSAGI